MEDNIYELSQAWKQLNENWVKIEEKKSDVPKKPGLGHMGKQGKAGVHDNKKWAEHKGFKAPKHKKELDENTGAATAIPGGTSSAGPIDATVAGGGNVAQFKKKLGVKTENKKKKLKEEFDIATLAGPQAAEVEIEPEVESPAVSDIIAGLQARYPGAIIEITVTAPEGHCFSDSDVSTATEVANSSEAPEELGGAWEKVNGETEEDEDDGTKPLAESYPPSFGKSEETEEAGEEDTEDENTEEDTEEDTEEADESEENDDDVEVESAAGIGKESITLSPELWSAFLVQADNGQEEVEGEENFDEEDPTSIDKVDK
jgi:hypothetical protein